MGHEHIGQAHLLLQVHQQIQHLRLNGHVQSGNRLVAHDEFGIQGQCPGNTHSLAAAAVHFMGVSHPQPVLDANQIHQFLCPLLDLLAGEASCFLQGLPDGFFHAVAGIQGGVGILEHNAHLLPEAAQLLALGKGDVLAVQENLAVGGILKADDGTAQGRLAAAGFAHHTHGAALLDLEGHIIHGVVDTGAHLKVFLQVFDFQQCHISFPPSLQNSSGRNVRG